MSNGYSAKENGADVFRLRREPLRSKPLHTGTVAIAESPSLAPKNREVTRHLIVAVALLGLAALLWTISDAVVIAFGGIVVATVWLSLSLPLSSRFGIAQRWSLLVVRIGLFLLSLAGLWLFGNELVDQFSGLQHRLPEATEKLKTWLSSFPFGRAIVESLTKSGANTEVLTRVSAGVAALLGATGNLLLIVFLGIYFASDPTLYRDGALRLFPVRRRPQVKRALNDCGRALQKWLVAQAAAMAAVGVLTGASLGLIKLPFALSLGVLAALLEFIPVIGPILSAVPAIILAFGQGPQMALYVTLIYVGVQQIESNVITPLVQRWAVKLPPVVGLIAIVAFGLIFGVLGVVFAMPIAVVVMVLIKDLYVEDTLEAGEKIDNPPERARGAAAGRKV